MGRRPNDHYEFLRAYIERAIGEGHKEHVEHRKLDCELPGPCSLHSAVIVPLVVESEVAGTLIVVSGVAGKRQIRMADETARFICTQLELAELEKSRSRWRGPRCGRCGRRSPRTSSTTR